MKIQSNGVTMMDLNAGPIKSIDVKPTAQEIKVILWFADRDGVEFTVQEIDSLKDALTDVLVQARTMDVLVEPPASTAPRVFNTGDVIPEEVTTVLDRAHDWWRRPPSGGWICSQIPLTPERIQHTKGWESQDLLTFYGPVTEVL